MSLRAPPYVFFETFIVSQHAPDMEAEVAFNSNYSQVMHEGYFFDRPYLAKTRRFTYQKEKETQMTIHQAAQQYFKEHRDFIAMTNTNLYDSIYFLQHWLAMRGHSAFQTIIKLEKEYVKDTGIKQVQKDIQAAGFILRSMVGYTEALHFDDAGMPDVAVFIIYHEHRAIVAHRDSSDMPAQLEQLFEPYKNKSIKVHEYHMADGKTSVSYREMDSNTVGEWYPQFYPYFNIESIKDYWTAFSESKANVLLLIGPPGTGKTNFLKHLIVSQSKPVMTASNEQVIMSGQLFSEFISSECAMLVMEDADRLTTSRESGNTTMAELLNAATGITSQSSNKIVISTNLPSLSKVDPALIRQGRCYQTLEFKRLTTQQAQCAYKALHEDDDAELPEKESGYTLAEALNYDADDDSPRTIARMGF